MTVVASETPKPWALQNLPPFPPVALRVLEELSHEDPQLDQVVSWINADPSFSAELLRVANSALFGFASQILSVRQAAVALGYEFVKSLAMTVALRNYLQNAIAIPALKHCWRHCLGCALITERVAMVVGAPAEAAYTAGLLHDVGRLALMAAWPEEYANVLSTVAEHGFTLIEVERAAFDVDHCEAGMWLAGEWNLPVELRESIGRHHEEGGKLEPSKMYTIVRAGCWLADALGFGALPPAAPAKRQDQRPELPEELQGRLDLEALMNTTAARIAAVL